MSKAVTKKEDNLPSAIEDEIFETAGDGIDYDTSELQIPFLRLVQAMSPHNLRKQTLSLLMDVLKEICLIL